MEPTVFALSSKENEAANKFFEKHRRKCHANNLRYIFQPTAIGTIVKVQCPICKKKKEVTDYELW